MVQVTTENMLQHNLHFPAEAEGRSKKSTWQEGSSNGCKHSMKDRTFNWLLLHAINFTVYRLFSALPHKKFLTDIHLPISFIFFKSWSLRLLPFAKVVKAGVLNILKIHRKTRLVLTFKKFQTNTHPPVSLFLIFFFIMISQVVTLC